MLRENSVGGGSTVVRTTFAVDSREGLTSVAADWSETKIEQGDGEYGATGKVSPPRRSVVTELVEGEVERGDGGDAVGGDGAGRGRSRAG